MFCPPAKRNIDIVRPLIFMGKNTSSIIAELVLEGELS